MSDDHVVFTQDRARDVLRRAFEETGLSAEQAVLLAAASEALLKAERKVWWRRMFGW